MSSRSYLGLLFLMLNYFFQALQYHQLLSVFSRKRCEVKSNTELNLMIAITAGEFSSNWYKTNRVSSIHTLRNNDLKYSTLLLGLPKD